jgi:hypothetical protein
VVGLGERTRPLSAARGAQVLSRRARKNVQLADVKVRPVAFALAFALAVALAFALAVALAVALAFALAVALAFALAVALAFALVCAGRCALSCADAGTAR